MRSIMLILVVCGLAATAHAKNIDLSTVPARDTVQLTIYNAEDLTLVRETRKITFKPGNNPLQFSWANTLIDPTSVELRFLDHADELVVLDTTFPHDKPQMLYWNVKSDFAGEAMVEISYFTSGISWAADYVGIANADEDAMALEGFVTVTNHSGEDYEDAQVRLVVGKINLVEQIAQLAQQGIAGSRPEDELRMFAMRRSVGRAETLMGVAKGATMPAMDALEEKQIVKEGLSEYFIFTIDGTETVPNRWSKRMRSFAADDVPVKVQYRYRPREYGHQLVKMLLMANDSESELGESPLPDGVVRLFQRTEREGLSYLTQQSIQYIPIGDKIELNLGANPEVVFELITMRVFRDNIWGSWRPNLRQRFDQPGMRIDDKGRVTGWDEHAVYAQRIRNYTDRAIDVEVRRVVPGDAIFKSELDPTLHDFQTVQYTATVEPGGKRDLMYETITARGDSAKQSRVELEAGDPAAVPWM